MENTLLNMKHIIHDKGKWSENEGQQVTWNENGCYGDCESEHLHPPHWTYIFANCDIIDLAKCGWQLYMYILHSKILLMCFKALHSLAPEYISHLLKWFSPSHSLRSDSQYLLVVPRTNCKTFGDCAWSVEAQILWDSLPSKLRCCDWI